MLRDELYDAGLLLERQQGWFIGVACILQTEGELELVLVLAYDLHKLLESAGDIVCVRELRSKLVFDLLGLVET